MSLLEVRKLLAGWIGVAIREMARSEGAKSLVAMVEIRCAGVESEI